MWFPTQHSLSPSRASFFIQEFLESKHVWSYLQSQYWKSESFISLTLKGLQGARNLSRSRSRSRSASVWVEIILR
jgi:hypothetical protein